MGRILPVILCGGSGTRLWPLSRNTRPKQFLNLTDNRLSLLQKTALRGMAITGCSPDHILAVTHHLKTEMVKNQLDVLNPLLSKHIIGEKISRNTGPAIFEAASYVAENFSPDDILFVMPSDAHIGNEDILAASARIAIHEAGNDRIAIFGIPPSRPETGYGYIKKGWSLPDNPGSFTVDRFVEKPSLEVAQSYLKSGHYLWNSGMFVARASTLLNEFTIHAPDLMNGLKSMSFDKAVLEYSGNVSIIPCDPDWSDVGSWQSLWDVMQRTPNGNSVQTGVLNTLKVFVKSGWN